MSNFVHLHVHSDYSLLDGAIRVKHLVNKAKEFNMPAVALTDHGNMYGAVDFYSTAVNAGIKPILGSEMYVAPESMLNKSKVGSLNYYHLILLVMNRKGYSNIIKLQSDSFIKGFYYKPRVDFELLKEYNEGLISTSACIQGPIAYYLKNDDDKKAREMAEKLASIFKDRFYIEIQSNGMEIQEKVNNGLIQISKELGLPVIATTDAHYLTKKDAIYHEAILCLQSNTKLDDPNRRKFPTNEFYFKSTEEMKAAFSYIPEAISNTVDIANKIDFEMEFNNIHMPKFPVPKEETETSYFEKIAREKLEILIEKLKNKNGLTVEKEKEYRDRFEMEFDVIVSKGFPGYFLIVQDFIENSRKKGILIGPGRGSAAGSLISYVLGITTLDPLEYGLIFERFLNPERESLPDIDVDIEKRKREQAIEYITQKYGGEEYVSRVITFNLMKPKLAFKEMARIIDIPFQEANKITDLISDIKEKDGGLSALIKKEPKIQELIKKDSKIAKAFEYAENLQFLTKNAGTHAGGIIIADKPLKEYMPLAIPKNDVTSQFEKMAVEKIGLVKFDLLGLKTLSQIEDTLQFIEQNRNEKIILDDITLDDEGVYELLSSGDVDGVFQLESEGMRRILMELKPTTIHDIIALIALFRPGPLDSGMIPDFIKRKHNEIPIEYPLDVLKPILEETYGVILYQEQVMKIASVMAGYSLGEADILRKAMGKKDAALMEKEKAKFVEGAINKGFSKEKSEFVFDLIRKFAGYGFNKSHSAAYGLVSYWTAYLKTNYSIEFMAGLLSTLDVKSNKDKNKILRYITECKTMGIEILPPDINKSAENFTIDNNKIRFALNKIQGLGSIAINSIILEREKGGEYKNLYDFAKRVDISKVNKKVFENLVKAGAFDSINKNRANLYSLIPEVIEYTNKINKDKTKGMKSLFGDEEFTVSDFQTDKPEVKPWNEKERLAYEKETLGFYITGHPLEQYQDAIKLYCNTTTDTIKERGNNAKVYLIVSIEQFTRAKTKNNKNYAKLLLNDMYGSVEARVWEDVLNTNEQLITTGKIIYIEATTDIRENSVNLIVNSVSDIDKIENKNIKEIILTIEKEMITQEMIADLKEILNNNLGKIKFSFKVIFPDDVTVFLSPYSISVKAGTELVSSLKNRFGDSSVQLIMNGK